MAGDVEINVARRFSRLHYPDVKQFGKNVDAFIAPVLISVSIKISRAETRT